jgi:hypothetical protein
MNIPRSKRGEPLFRPSSGVHFSADEMTCDVFAVAFTIPLMQNWKILYGKYRTNPSAARANMVTTTL